MPSRTDIARAAAESLRSASDPPPALVGFDGFIDSIVHMVDRRTDMSPAGYERLKTIPDFAARCAAAAGKSTNIERVLVADRFGGNGPLLASGLAGLGAPVTYIGAIGERAAGEGGGVAVHPQFAGFAARCRRVIPTGPPSATLCLEFDDGKLMFNDTSAVQAVTWERVVAAAGPDELLRIAAASRIIGVVNWSLMGGVPGIWEGLARDILPRCSGGPRVLVIDLSDPAKRADQDIRVALGQLRALDRLVPVTLGLNLAEAERLARVLGADIFERRRQAPLAERVLGGCREIRQAAQLSCVAVHPREGAGAACSDGTGAWFDGPFTRTPHLSTGAGDHFNSGFAFARALALPVEQCLAVACATSGAYVRDAASPSRERVVEFLRDLPGPE